jgi:hypothetical protein
MQEFEQTPPLIVILPEDEYKCSSHSYRLAFKPRNIYLNPKSVARLDITKENSEMSKEFKILSALLASYEIAHICIRFRQNI